MKPSLWMLLSVFVAVYGGMHYYIYRRLILVVSSPHWLLAIALAILAAAPLLTAWFANQGYSTVALPTAKIGYTWMGFAFLFFSASLLLDLCRLCINLADRFIFPQAASILPSATSLTGVALVLALAATAYGYVAARRINIVNIDYPSEKVPTRAGTIRIVQISDLHLGLLTDEGRIRRLVHAINALQPDIVASTGDLVDAQPDHLSKFIDLLANLRPRLGKYAVTGNHEAFAGLDNALALTRQAGFDLLSGQVVNADDMIIVGVDDPAVVRRGNGSTPDETALLSRTDQEKFVLLLKHQPVVDQKAAGLFDLQLSGHTHGGQIFPFGLLTRLVYALGPGLHRVSGTGWMYVSRGTGTWGPPIRFLAPAEITLILLHHGNGRPKVLQRPPY